MDKRARATLVSVALIAASLAAMAALRVPYEGVGRSVVDAWCAARGGCAEPTYINSPRAVIEQGLSLGLFLTVIAATIVSMDYRYFAALLGIVALVFLGAISPQLLLQGVEWGLILFLVGSMTLAYILRRLGVFEYLAVRVLEVSRGKPAVLAALLSLLSWFLSMAVGEVTSVVYVMMLVLDIYRLTRYDVKPLVVLSVLATNTGSVALPIGNPIGIYLAFTANLSVKSFLVRALPISLACLALLVALFSATMRDYLRGLRSSVSGDRLEKMVAEFYSNLTPENREKIAKGLAILAAFLIAIGTNDYLAELVSWFGGVYVDSHSLLAFSPYPFLVAAGSLVDPSSLGEAIEKGVEWPSILFFVSLFMLGYSLLWSGAAPKVAYFTALLSSPGGQVSFPLLYSVLLVLSAALSSVLDNLSVIVALTPVARTVVSIGGSAAAYWALLYGGVFGGNYTPIGSTANIVAVGIAERHKIDVGWASWLRIAALATSAQIAAAVLWNLAWPLGV